MSVSSRLSKRLGVAPAVDPFVQPSGQRPRKQVGEREQSPLAAVEDVEVLDRFVDLAIFQLVQPVPVLTFEQHLHERVQEVQVLRCRVERERVDRDVMLAQSDLEVAPVEERRELPIAVAEIEDDRQRVVLLCVGHQEVEEEALAAAGGAEDQRVPDVLDVQVEGVRRVMRGLEDRQGVTAEMRADPFAAVQREQEAEVRGVGLEQRQAAQVVGAVAGHDAQPGVQQVVGLLEQAAVVHRDHLHRLGRLVLQLAAIVAVQDERQGTGAKEVAVDLELRQGIAQLPDRGARGIVDEHLLRSGVWRDVVDQRHAFVEEVPTACLQLAPHPVAREPLPLQARDQFSRDRVEVAEEERERLARRFLRGQHLDEAMADHEVIALALDRGIRDEVVEVRVVGEAARRRPSRDRS